MRLVPYIRSLSFTIACLGVVIAADASAQATLQPEVFAERPGPEGIEVDSAENVYLQWDNVSSLALTSFRPDSSVRAEVPVGGFTSIFLKGRLARIPGTDNMLWLGNGGLMLAFGPDLQVQQFLDLTPLSFQTQERAFDITTGQFRQFQTGNASWGDVAVFRVSSERLFIYATATTGASGGFPFVVRIDLDTAQNTVAASVVAWSSGTTAGDVNVARGIAVNAQGWVLTGFPFLIPNGGFADTLVAFGVGFPEAADAAPPVFILGDNNTQSGIQDAASFGMTSDALGNFYVATGVVGSSLCGTGGSSALLLIPQNPTLAVRDGRCFPLPAIIARSTDVAVSPTRLIPYMTVNNQVWRFPALITPSAESFSAIKANRTKSDPGFMRRLMNLAGTPVSLE